ncbi:MAG: DUF885 family protein [Amphiplicatus sp.]
MSSASRRLFILAPAVALLALPGCGREDARSVASETAPAPAAAETDPSSAFLDMAARQAARMLKASPEMATSLGVSEEIAGADYKARLGDYGFEASQQARAMNEEFLQELKLFDRAALAGTAATTYDILRAAFELGARRNQFEFGGAAVWGLHPPYLVTQLSGPHLYLPRLLETQHPIESKKDVEAYLARLGEFGRVFDEVVETVGADAALAVTPPLFAIDGALGAIERLTAPAPADNRLTTSLVRKMEGVASLSPEERASYAAKAAELVGAVVYPAYKRLAAMLESLKEQAGPDAGIWRLGEQGTAFYQLALNAYGANGMTGEEIHALGLAEVERIAAEMDAILKAQGLSEGSVAERFIAIGARPGMVYPNTDEARDVIIAELNHQVAEVMARAPGWFSAIPDTPVEVRRIPVHEQESASGGYYAGPSLDGTRPGVYWINLKDTADWPKPMLKTLAYHEAAPGHHFQIALQRAVPDMPLIRNMAVFPEFTEGWALYAEQVAAEMGMYADDPLGDLGRLQSELFRAARLVVDSGLHAKQWTREEAIDYMTATAGEPRSSATREVERYAVWPGQACAYKLGMIRINRLRKKAEAALGDEFDIRAFHDAVLLGGARPLSVLDRDVERFIAARRKS